MGTGLQTFIRRLDHPPGRHNDSGSLPSALQSASPSPIPSGAHAFRPSKSRGPSVPAVWSSAVTHTRAPCPVILFPCLCPRPSPQTRASVSPQGLLPPSPALPSYPRLTAQTAHHVQPAPQPHAPAPAGLSHAPRVLTPQAVLTLLAAQASCGRKQRRDCPTAVHRQG